MHTFSNDKGVYSVDMLISWVNEFKPKHILVNLEDVANIMTIKSWSTEKATYSPLDVLINPKKYPDDMKRIKQANLRYPILLYQNHLIDGAHRVTHAYLKNKKSIKAIIVPTNILRKVKIANKYSEVCSMHTYEVMQLYNNRFHKKSKNLKSKNPQQGKHRQVKNQ